MRRAIPRKVHELVIECAGGRCEYCKTPQSFSSDTFSIDHTDPLKEGGTDDDYNLALSCQGCNGPKSAATKAQDPVTDIVVPLFHPRKDRWTDHFQWSTDFCRVEGITPTGRATVQRLQLNREGVINLRRVLHAMNEGHPPPDTLT